MVRPASSPGQPQDGFIGRDRELVRSRSLLRSARLLTLVGPGGVGKTRLAGELVARLNRGDVHCVSLGSLSQPGHLPEVVAAAMGERIVSQPLSVLAEAIGGRRLLLVLDNCEHLIDDVAGLTDSLLRQCPGLRVLATSREPLRVPGEVVFAVTPLSLPEQTCTATSSLRYDAVALFVARARACYPEFALTSGNVATVVDICRRLDGLPLALELAARQLSPAHGPEEILAELGDQFTLPVPAVAPDPAEADDRIPRRHHELRTTMAWSYQLLTSTEQAVFRRVSILWGDFCLEQAAAVCGMDADELRPVLSDLAAKSLVVALSADGTGVRFRQLNTIRSYACARLSDCGERSATTARTIRWLMTLATALLQTVFLNDDLQGWLRTEGDNLIAAVKYAAAVAGDPAADGQPATSEAAEDTYVLLALALARYWRAVGQDAAAHALLTGLQPRTARSRYRTCVLTQAAGVTANRGDAAEAARLAQAAVDMGRRQDEPMWLAKALDELGRARVAAGDVDGAIACANEGSALLRAIGLDHEAARVEGNLAWVLSFAGRTAEAAQVMARCLPVLRTHAPAKALAAVLHTAASISLAEGNVSSAEAAFAEGLGNTQLETVNAAYQLDGLAMVAARRGDCRRALCLSTAASAMRTRIGVKADPAWRRQVGRDTREASRELGPAKAGAARAAGRRLQGERLVTYAGARLGRRLGNTGELTAREHQVADLVARGLTNRDIADELALSGKTVSAHLDSIRDKLGFRTRTQIAVWAATPERPAATARETTVVA